MLNQPFGGQAAKLVEKSKAILADPTLRAKLDARFGVRERGSCGDATVRFATDCRTAIGCPAYCCVSKHGAD